MLLAEDGDVICLKACASVLQPMCAKEAGRRRVDECTGKEEAKISSWISCFILADTSLSQGPEQSKKIQATQKS